MSILHVRDLVKNFGTFQALNGVNLDLEPGEVLGFIGPNGAGKSTTIRILLGLLRKDGGQVRLLGGDPWSDAVALHRRIAFVPGDVNLWPDLTGGEVIDLLASLGGACDAKRRNDLIERFQLDPTKRCRTYSKGNRQKVAIVAAFASDADLYILVEPTSGLDPLMEHTFQECVAEVKLAGKSVLLSSHILSEVEKLCDRVSIIRKGEVVESGTLADLRHLTRTSINVETEKPIAGLERMPEVNDLAISGNRVSFQVDSDRLNTILGYLTQFDVRALTVSPPTLEELFMRHYGDDVADPTGNSEPKAGVR